MFRRVGNHLGRIPIGLEDCTVDYGSDFKDYIDIVDNEIQVELKL